MGSERTESGTGVPGSMEVQERGYNPPPVAKVERPAPSRPAPRPRPSGDDGNVRSENPGPPKTTEADAATAG